MTVQSAAILLVLISVTVGSCIGPWHRAHYRSEIGTPLIEYTPTPTR